MDCGDVRQVVNCPYENDACTDSVLAKEPYGIGGCLGAGSLGCGDLGRPIDTHTDAHVVAFEEIHPTAVDQLAVRLKTQSKRFLGL
jgi:hypothetical protein